MGNVKEWCGILLVRQLDVPKCTTTLGIDLQHDATQYRGDRLTLPNGLTPHHLRHAIGVAQGVLLADAVHPLEVFLLRQEQNHPRLGSDVLVQGLHQVSNLIRADHPSGIRHLHSEGHLGNVLQRPKPNVYHRSIAVRIDEEPILQRDGILKPIAHPPLEVALLNGMHGGTKLHLQLRQLHSVQFMSVPLKSEAPIFERIRHICGSLRPVTNALEEEILGRNIICKALLWDDLGQLDSLLQKVPVLPQVIGEAGDLAHLRHQENLLGCLLCVGL
mmetsp:Transcript_54243/g.129287  ORF Transcript_54243/g.129287 Transcript_54243/m.129287 type:complete len:274 (-) Transcript_54243:1059-1880(-)